MTQMLELNKMGMESLTEIEMIGVDGGNWFTEALKQWGAEKLFDYVWEHRSDLAGFLAYMVQNPIRPSEYR